MSAGMLLSALVPIVFSKRLIFFSISYPSSTSHSTISFGKGVGGGGDFYPVGLNSPQTQNSHRKHDQKLRFNHNERVSRMFQRI